MPRLPPAGTGDRLVINKREVEFSFWPTRRSTRRHRVQSRVFVSDPWNVIENVINKDCPDASKKLALAFAEQSRDFFNASQHGGVRVAKPLLIYYSFMNLAKAFILFKNKNSIQDLSDSYHGLTLKHSKTGFKLSNELSNEKLVTYPNSTTQEKKNLFDLLKKALTGKDIGQKKVTYELSRLLPQILLGHRLWCGASRRKERFIEIEKLEFINDKAGTECWIRFNILKSEFKRFGYAQREIMSGAKLQNGWRVVVDPIDADLLMCIEMSSGRKHTNHPSDVLNDLVNSVRHIFWRSVTITRPFRKYYTYIADKGDTGDSILPQLCSIYAVFFYLGSITRYRPDHFAELIAGPYGAFIQEFIENQPKQWLYLMASEFAEQEVTKAAVA